ncbi:hypothetical protein LguiA_001608 [Lonicera macranthoides]
MDLKGLVESSGVAIGLLIGEVLTAGLQLLSKVVMSSEENSAFMFALMTYRHLLAAVCLVPVALYFERGNVKNMTWSACLWLFMVALTGISIGLGFFYFGQRDTTATYATNFLNLIPIVTFIFSAILRIERLRVRTRAGKIKIGGAILCLGGALTISLYKGTTLHIGPHRKYEGATMIYHHNYKRGTLFLVASILAYAARFIMQVKLSNVFPYKYWATTLICIMASFQQVIIGLCMKRNKAAWSLGWNLQLVWVISGAMVSIVTSCLVLWAVVKRGPTYPSMFKPISLILVAVAEALFFHQDITLGSLLGMCIIIIGLYLFLWAKNKEVMAPSPPLEVLTRDPTNEVTQVQANRALVK